MRLKQLAVALLCSGAFVAPAFAQTNIPNKTTTQTTTSPGTPTATGLGSTSTSVPTTTTTTGQATSTTTTVPTSATPPAPMAPKPMTAAVPQTGLTNINTATTADLDKLPQIGKARAAKIIGARPYKTTDELLSKKVLSKSVYDKIKDKITA